MPETDQRSKVTVEDLLRLKRAERPAPEFWANFERELRQKQLTALIEKRPWWQELPQLFARRIYLPVGATAILAFTLVSVKYHAPAQLAEVAPPVGSPVSVDLEPSVAAVPVSSPLVNRSESVSAESEEVAASAATPSTEVIELMPLLAPRQAETPSARLLAANLAHLEQADANFQPAGLGNLSPATREQAPVAELASVPTTSNRRNRLLASYDGRQVSPEPSLPEIVRQKLTRGLGDAEPDRGSRLLARELNGFSTPMPQIVALRF
jgi:hypothetical protein